MPDTSAQPQSTSGQGGLIISADIAQKFSDVIALIKASESMNDEERQYWINTLPAMTPDQVKSLKEILMNEQRQLAAIDAKYQAKTKTDIPERPIEEIAHSRKEKRHALAKSEMQDSEEETKKEQELLQIIEST